MNKKGISLITLIITIVLIIILVSMTTVGIGNAIENARRTSFGNDLVAIEDAIDLYYIQNGNFPILEENDEYIEYLYNTDKLSSTIGESIPLELEFLNEFKMELIQNLDFTNEENIVSDTIFYKIDLSKIDIKNISRGTGKDGENDIFVMSYPSNNVYYVKGLKNSDKIYFSLINITNVKKSDIRNDKVITNSESGVTVTKEKRAWTNTLGINITANLSSNEKLYVKLPIIESEIPLNTVIGENNIFINSLSESLGISGEEINEFNKLDALEKVMNVIKRTDGIETANIKVNLANYETESPTFPLKEDGKTFDFTITSNDGYNRVSFIGNDKISGIREVRYVYLTEFGDNYIPKMLYGDINILTSEYMLENGKKAYVSNTGKVEIKLPKDVEAIYITMYDKAGNSVSMQKNVQNDIYIGINATNISSKLKFDVGIKSNTTITSAKAAISLNGIDFIDQKDIILAKDNNEIYNSIIEFDNLDNKEVYIKVVAYDNSNPQIQETRIKKINLEEVATKLVSSVIPGLTYEENRYYTDRNGNSAIVPSGFGVSVKSDEQTIDDGLVILDKADNEYVWIPCTIDGSNNSIKYEKWTGSSTGPAVVSADQTGYDTSPNGVLNETDQIEEYGGFYVARYEASLPDEQTTEELMMTKLFTAIDNNRTDIGKAQSKPNKIIWYNIDYTNAKIVSENVISTDYVQSGLVTETQWDTMLKFIETAGIDTNTDCTSWGNYSNKYGYTINGYYKKTIYNEKYNEGEYLKEKSEHLLLQSGKFGNIVKEGKQKNLYDVAGSVWEWNLGVVIQKGGESTAIGRRILRGGSFTDSGTESIASYRHGNSLDNRTQSNIGFRFVLYIK